MAQIICFANSTKHNERCIAGIDKESGKWIRPVYEISPKSGICLNHRSIGEEPALLDIIDIQVDDIGPDVGCQKENRTLLVGEWCKKGRISKKNSYRIY